MSSRSPAPPDVPAALPAPPVVADIEQVLQEAITTLTPAEPGPGQRGPGRPRLLPASQVVADIERFVREAIAARTRAEPGPGQRGPGRPRVLPALCLWAGLLVCVLHGFTSHLALWRLLTSRDFWRCPRVAISDQ